MFSKLIRKLALQLTKMKNMIRKLANPILEMIKIIVIASNLGFLESEQ